MSCNFETFQNVLWKDLEGTVMAKKREHQK